jgi:deoxyribonuclease V
VLNENLELQQRAPSAVELRIRIPSKISPKEAIALQKKLSPLVQEIGELPPELHYLLGCDASYFRGTTFAAASLVDYEKLELLRVKCVKERTRFPYIPGLLAFREAPSVLRAIKSLRARSYVCLVDAHGLAHPRRFGLACFVGVALNRPTIGVAKSLLYGRVRDEKVFDEEARQIAEILPLPGSRKVIYVSVGHKISLNDAVKIVRHCLTKRGPIPVSLAHEEVTKQKWLVKKSSQASS